MRYPSRRGVAIIAQRFSAGKRREFNRVPESLPAFSEAPSEAEGKSKGPKAPSLEGSALTCGADIPVRVPIPPASSKFAKFATGTGPWNPTFLKSAKGGQSVVKKSATPTVRRPWQLHQPAPQSTQHDLFLPRDLR